MSITKRAGQESVHENTATQTNLRPKAWQKSGKIMVKSRQEHAKSMPKACQKHCKGKAIAWQRHGTKAWRNSKAHKEWQKYGKKIGKSMSKSLAKTNSKAKVC